MEVADRVQLLSEVAASLAADPGYLPLLPRLASNSIFEVVVKEIHLLPGNVISPVVHYERLRQTLEQFVEDSRSLTHRDLSAERRLLIYSDYAATYDRLEGLARHALRALETSPGINKTVGDPSSPAPASAKDGVSTADSSP